MTTWCMCIACKIPNATNTHRLRNTHWFTLRYITLYVHCLSWVSMSNIDMILVLYLQTFRVYCRVSRGFFFPVALRPSAGHYLFIHEVSRSYSDAPHSVWLLWTIHQLVSETSTWQPTTLTTDRHPWPWWDSNPQPISYHIMYLEVINSRIKYDSFK